MRILGLAGLLGLEASSASAALWEDPLWALSGKADATGGYDSNIYAVNGGPGDYFSTFKPQLDLTSKDALLDFDTAAWVGWTGFATQTANDSTDPGFRMTLQYPANVASMPTQEAEVHWIRTTTVNVDVGQRVSQDDAFAKYEGQLLDSGKTSLDGRVSFDRDAYLGAAFDTIYTSALGVSADYSPDGLFKSGLGYDLTLGRSEPNTPGIGSLNQTEQALTYQLQGEFTPKLTGKVSFGGAYSEYTGSFTHNEWDAVAAADLVWKPRERLEFDLGAARAPSFNADGDIDVSSTLSLGVRQELPQGFSIHADVLGGWTNHDRAVTYRSDTIEGAGLALSYDLTGKLTASVGSDWTRQDSDISTFTYRRYVTYGQVEYRF